eukprot:4931122-Lingulodinium_polyedra.AAC.1
MATPNKAALGCVAVSPSLARTSSTTGGGRTSSAIVGMRAVGLLRVPGELSKKSVAREPQQFR